MARVLRAPNAAQAALIRPLCKPVYAAVRHLSANIILHCLERLLPDCCFLPAATADVWGSETLPGPRARVTTVDVLRYHPRHLKRKSKTETPVAVMLSFIQSRRSAPNKEGRLVFDEECSTAGRAFYLP